MQGDGSGVKDFRIDRNVATKEECLSRCTEERANRPEVNGATYGVVGGNRAKECYCETGMTGSNNARGTWITKLIQGSKL